MTHIQSVRAQSVAYPEPNDAGATRYLTFARVETDEGVVGWGEAITQSPSTARATNAVIDGFADLVVGSDPLTNVDTWRKLKQSSWWYGHRGGIASFAIAAIDIALWDIKGKILGVPVIDLIGGAHVDRLPVVASTHAFDADLQAEAERQATYVHEMGYIGVKVGLGKRGEARLGYDHERDVEFMRRLRDSLGPNPWIMLDRGQHLPWDVATAIRRTNAFEEFDLKWIEEPLEPDNFTGFRQLRRHVKCLVATGEREWDRRGFQEVIDSGIVDVVGCDVGRAEGITGALGVISLIEQANVWFNSHAWSSAINTAASIALSASTPHCLLQELKPDVNPMQHELVHTPFQAKNGWIDVPREPGLGVDVDETVLRRYEMT